VFKLDMRPVLLIQKPAVIMQKFQNFPNRHSIIIRVFYTCVKRLFKDISVFLKGYLPGFFPASGFLGGLPIGASRIFSRVSGVSGERQ
jgi:hypothetical protein